MDERLEKALEFSNYLVTLSNQQRVLKEKFLSSCVFYTNGGSFTVSKELINFAHLLTTYPNKEVILVDDNNTPIQIKDITQFFSDIFNLYNKAVSSYYTEYTKLKQKRSVESLVQWHRAF